MVKELIPYVDAKYRVAPGRQNRAMAGLSAGGAATYNVGLKHLELFSAFGMFSAAGGGGADFATRYPQLAADPKAANDRISNELGLLHSVPREEWVTGRSNASVIMAAFCHPRPGGSRCEYQPSAGCPCSRANGVAASGFGSADRAGRR